MVIVILIHLFLFITAAECGELFVVVEVRRTFEDYYIYYILVKAILYLLFDGTTKEYVKGKDIHVANRKMNKYQNGKERKTRKDDAIIL